MTNTPFAAEPGVFSGPPAVRVSSPADVLAVVPHLLGFHPDNSFVVIGAGAGVQATALPCTWAVIRR